MEQDQAKHSGYVALIGRTNVGKSTFLNAIMEAKIAIVSSKPQTTRKQILGIRTTEKGQIVFFDSPGIHKPHFRLNEKMMKDVYASLTDADLILYFIDISDRKQDEFVLSLLKDLKKDVFLVINKIDKFGKGKILQKIDQFKDVYPWAEIVPISALKEISLDLLEELIYKYLPENEGFYPDDELTLQTEKFYVAELVREKVLLMVEDELPFTTTVKVEKITDKEKVLYIRAEIYVENLSQKKILVGKHGNFVKLVGKLARKELEDYYDRKVYLDLFIKVVPNWRNSPTILSQLDE
ncbi:MAG: GTPase Era [Candidatus Aminicenantes bacterium]|nr:GTPase Era [Candidatus Aminicenantes bacterium]NIM83693.1 GTPase Era [Candidatus Aminicenantes bacterium]NIN23118.1 GTPase Era [Candidatus Aminicenantes bacterium]NIN46845.1 GTPase Era [Candidatus Aminicenantes bacterium]NIN89767.1 GTPase Era [Candidatus Aminicenantes bacterium]